MDNQAEEEKNLSSHSDLINTFCDITSSSREEAIFFLESHTFDLDSAVSTFLETSTSAAADAAPGVVLPPQPQPQPQSQPQSSPSYSPSASPSSSPSRSRSPSPTPPRRALPSGYSLRSRQQPMASKKPSGSRSGGIRTLSDINRPSTFGSDSDSDEPQEYYTGGEKSGMLVQDPSKVNNVDAIFNQARQAGATERPADNLRPSSSSRSFTGTGRLLSGETVSAAPQPPEAITHNIIFWGNGFTVDDGPLRGLDDPANASFLESITKSECPKELEPADRRTAVRVNLMRKEEDYSPPENPHIPFHGVGRTLGGTSSTSLEPTVAAPSLPSAPPPSMGLILDEALPATSIQLRLADGTRMVARFNYRHTIRDIRAFIDASRPGGSRVYGLQTVGFPPKQLADLDQTIEEAGIANSVVLQKP